MTVIFQVKDINELDEISFWLAKRKIVIHQVVPEKLNAEELLQRLRKLRIQLPSGYQFDRAEANER